MKERRKIHIIKSKFQQRLILEAMLISFIFVNIILIISFLLPSLEISRLHYNLVIAFGVVILELVGFALIYYLSKKNSLRIAGPVYRFEQTLQAVADGDLTAKINLRKDDHFDDSAEIINNSIENLRCRIESIQQSFKDLSEIAPNVDSMQKNLIELHEKLAQFKTGSQLLEKPKAN